MAQPPLVLTAHFIHTQNPHGGAFGLNSSLAVRARAWASAIALRRARIGDLALRIMHDDPTSPDGSAGEPSVVLQRVELAHAREMAANDLRWLAFDQLMAHEYGLSDCVFVVDVSDVGIIGNLSDLCRLYPLAIFGGSDSCGIGGARGVKAWMRSQAVRSNFSLLSAPWLQHVLSQRTSVPVVFNCGIAGGVRHVFAPFVRAMAAAIREHYSRREAVAWRLVDMLVFNELLLQRLTRSVGGLTQPQSLLGWNRTVVTGWPLGVLNLPMWSTFCGHDACSMTAPAAGRAPLKADECVRRLMLQMAPRYYFVHKVPYLQHPLPVRAWTRGY